MAQINCQSILELKVPCAKIAQDDRDTHDQGAQFDGQMEMEMRPGTRLGLGMEMARAPCFEPGMSIWWQFDGS